MISPVPQRRAGRAALAASVALVLGVSGCRAQASASRPDSTEPRAIAGGTFEASGVAHVPGTHFVLFVDDGRRREIFLMELTAAGAQSGSAMALPLGADVTDIEGITTAGQHFYLVGSQSKKSGTEGDGLVRFTFDAAAKRVTGVERIQGLKGWLAANVPELHGADQRGGDEVLNIEAIAWDPVRQRLLLGLRAPVVDGSALVVPLKLQDPAGAFSRENLRIDGPALRLDLAGAGIRSLEYDEHAKEFRVITGSGGDDEDRDFRLVAWDGVAQTPLREISTHARGMKPEGVTRSLIGGRPRTVIVFDTGYFTLID